MPSPFVSIQQSACNALAAWLAPQFPDIPQNVLSRWQGASVQKQGKAITVVIAGKRDDIPLDPYPIAQANINATQANYTWAMRACRQPLQLDVWAQYDADRDDIITRLEPALTAGPKATGVNAFNGDPFWQTLILNMPAPWTGTGAFYFDDPEVFYEGSDVQVSTYRALYRGFVDVTLALTAQSARLVQGYLKAKVHEQGPAGVPPTNWLYDIVSVNNAGVITHSSGT